jgi:hypothetical protein
LPLSLPTYDGTMVTTSVTFAVDGVPTNPTTVALEYQFGDSGAKINGTGLIHQITVGEFSAGIDTSGRAPIEIEEVTVKWVGTGACQVTEQGTFPLTPTI